MMAQSHRSAAKSLWHVLFQLNGSIWVSVLPYCILNCIFMGIVQALVYRGIKIAFSPSGHGLMTLLITYLVISKVNLSYSRYLTSREAAGYAFSSIRELHQIILTYTSRHRNNDDARRWREQGTSRIIDLVDCAVRVLKNDEQAVYLVRNENPELATEEDPLLHVQALRMHIYQDSGVLFGQGIELLERVKLVEKIDSFVLHYQTLLSCATTPLPFPLVQMGRTFLFLWTFSIPLVLRGVVEDVWAAFVFVFFLTYGFVGLELVAMKLMNPFGDSNDDINITGMREAVVAGMERDLELFGEPASLENRRAEYVRQKPRQPQTVTWPSSITQSDQMNSSSRQYSGTSFTIPHNPGHHPYHSMDDQGN